MVKVTAGSWLMFFCCCGFGLIFSERNDDQLIKQKFDPEDSSIHHKHQHESKDSSYIIYQLMNQHWTHQLINRPERCGSCRCFGTALGCHFGGSRHWGAVQQRMQRNRHATQPANDWLTACWFLICMQGPLLHSHCTTYAIKWLLAGWLLWLVSLLVVGWF